MMALENIKPATAGKWLKQPKIPAVRVIDKLGGVNMFSFRMKVYEDVFKNVSMIQINDKPYLSG